MFYLDVKQCFQFAIKGKTILEIVRHVKTKQHEKRDKTHRTSQVNVSVCVKVAAAFVGEGRQSCVRVLSVKGNPHNRE